MSEETEVEMDEEEAFSLITYTPDGRRLVCITGDSDPAEIDWRPPRRRLHLCDLTGDEEDREAALPFHLRAASLSPDRRYLAYVAQEAEHSSGEVLLFDLVGWAEAGRLAWDPGDAISDMDFSPSGETLATISGAGVVKLWPWRLLLGC